MAIILYASAVTAETCPSSNNPIPIPNNCSQYYDCTVPATPTLKTCPAGQYYDCMNLKCSATVYPACCSSDTTVNWTVMYPSPSSLLSYSCVNNVTLKNQMAGACGVYFQCTNNQILNQACAAGNAFNNLTASCQPSASCTNPCKYYV